MTAHTSVNAVRAAWFKSALLDRYHSKSSSVRNCAHDNARRLLQSLGGLGSIW